MNAATVQYAGQSEGQVLLQLLLSAVTSQPVPAARSSTLWFLLWEISKSFHLMKLSTMSKIKFFSAALFFFLPLYKMKDYKAKF